jgi:hypothetical protein
VCDVVVEEALRDGGGHGFEPCPLRGGVTLWVGAGQWGLSLKRFFSYLFKAFFGAGPKSSVLIDDLSTYQH